MFSHSKKDYYSWNSNIACEANQQQRVYETAIQMTGMQAQDLDEGADEGMYQSEMQAMPDMGSPEMVQTQMMIAEQMGPQAIRYDDVYHPRTDKRAISKSSLTTTLCESSWPAVHLRGK
jgi:hypothetical protein